MQNLSNYGANTNLSLFACLVSELGRSPGGMPKVKDFNHSELFTNLIVDSDWTVKKFSNSRSLVYRHAEVRERREQVNMVKQGGSEFPRRNRIILADVIENRF